MDALSTFKNILAKNKAGKQKAVVSVCSGHSIAIAAALRTAQKHQTIALIESTSNQVDQYGGYTGLTPKDFVQQVYAIADRENVNTNSILFGGDHLGPNRWQHLSAKEAMKKSYTLVSEYIKAGYKKIHLDASFRCADDKVLLDEAIIADRCAKMATVCEASNSGSSPLYVIGTEVPTPGGDNKSSSSIGRNNVTASTPGGDNTSAELKSTPPEDVDRVITVFRDAFKKEGLLSIWENVIALVVQPGVEFENLDIHHYSTGGNSGLSKTIEQHNGIVYEAHSTDYQTDIALSQLVTDHFAILKVGPWLTFALRESLFLLEQIENEMEARTPSNFKNILHATMKDDPKFWEHHYSASNDLEYQLSYSYFDRARYYLGHRSVASAMDRLFANLDSDIPLPLLSQFLPAQYKKICSGILKNKPYDLCVDRVCDVLDIYMMACGHDENSD